MKAIKTLVPFARRHGIRVSFAVTLLLAAGCAHVPRLGPSPTMKSVEELGAAQAFAAPAATWPGDGWWRAYGDPQLDELIDEALRGAPDLALAQSRLEAAAAAVTFAGAARIPEVTGSAALTEGKQSYNYLMPRQAVPNGWNDYGVATLNLSWELDFWGKNRSALAAALSEQQAAQAEVAQTRLILSTSVASAYAELVDLFTVRDTAEAALELRTKTVALFRQRHDFGLENLASVRQVEARRAAAEAELRSYGRTHRAATEWHRGTARRGTGPRPRHRAPSARFAGSTGLPPNLSFELLGRRPDIVAARCVRKRLPSASTSKRPASIPASISLAFVGVQSLGIHNLTKSGSQAASAARRFRCPFSTRGDCRGQLRGAHAEYDAPVATYNATLSNALREVADAATSRKSLDGELTAARAAVAAAGGSPQLVRKRYKGALATYLDVLEAEDELISARRAQAALETRALILDVSSGARPRWGFPIRPPKHLSPFPTK